MEKNGERERETDGEIERGKDRNSSFFPFHLKIRAFVLCTSASSRILLV